MKTKQEIKEMYEVIRKMRDSNNKDPELFKAHQDGQLDALIWVLSEDFKKNRVEQLNQEYLDTHKEITQ